MTASLLAGCVDSSQDERLEVVVSHGPLAWVSEQIGGDHVRVTSLTPAGADPHGIELSPSKVAELQSADLVVVISGLQPATDDALASVPPERVVDTLEAATEQVPGAAPPPDPMLDPHFWLDPARLALAAEQVGAALARAEPDLAEELEERTQRVVQDLDGVDTRYQEALAACEGATLVTTHEAFGYLAARYGLTQQGIAGVDPHVEPSPARLREVSELLTSSGATTIFFENEADPSVAETLAEDLGLDTDVLNPMERTDDLDYVAVMDANLAALRTGLICEG